ncbi:MAG: hypothetical protein OEV41_00800 [Gammaproteobacteria bacterium]|nr:hypothetical protein [Gammaproteobacteria bacterium]MDH5344509.1 hypothetical protein [Gammaproteobacteria bacterium]
MHILGRILFVAMSIFCSSVMADDKADMLAVADEALARITAEDSAGLAGLMIEEGMIYVGEVSEGRYRVQTRTYAETRDRVIEVDLIERGWNPTVLVSGTIGIVWYPYDIYVDSKWSHCGVDIFNMIRTEHGWRIAVLQYNVQQPPECEPHPEGPPAMESY